MALSEFLNGLTPGQIQSVGNMSVIPLVSHEEYTKVGSVDDVVLERDTNYSSLHLATKADYVTIVPNGMAFITKQNAQDRAVPSAHLLTKGGRGREVPAFCVQSTQNGYMRKSDTDHKVHLLPQSLRYKAFRKRTNRGGHYYANLWEDLERFNTSMGVGGNYLITFLNKYAEQLDQFVAEFELVDNQRGAIVLINDQVAGVEISPNHAAFRDVWKPMIRDCYGAESAFAAKQAKPHESAMIRDVESLDELVSAVSDAQASELQHAKSIVGNILSQAETTTVAEQAGNLELLAVDTEHYEGQAARTRDENEWVYVSLMSKPVKNRKFTWN